MAQPTWRHNDEQRRWELGYDDPVQAMLYGDPRIVVGSVSDDLFAYRAARDSADLKRYLAWRFTVPLPDEAYTGRVR